MDGDHPDPRGRHVRVQVRRDRRRTTGNPETNTQWQYGNNRTLGLNLSLHDEIALVEVVDTWRPGLPSRRPSSSTWSTEPVKEEGSTKLLHDVVRELRTEQALLDGSLNVLVLQEIADSAAGRLHRRSPRRGILRRERNGRRWRKRRRPNPRRTPSPRHPPTSSAEALEENTWPVFRSRRRMIRHRWRRGGDGDGERERHRRRGANRDGHDDGRGRRRGAGRVRGSPLRIQQTAA